MLTQYEAAFIAKHFLIAAVWADAPEGTHPRVTKQAQQEAELCARDFVESIGDAVFRRTLTAYEDVGLHPDCNGSPLGAFGHDLYLTLEGHGVGFWDRKELDIVPDVTGDWHASFLGDWLHAKCKASPWRESYGSGRLVFYRGWVYLLPPSK